ncbi:plasma-membrane proton-efflux P-type ATPase [Desulfovibrio sp. X2]|uniref:plasma-membrane proton-efflux P-type ATPase n=1 Tax=Desulfovibrio sp. X2 TaxID=941449 RepID=UPI0003589844|nr:plasma-membrane proton-efflux P-type ATPase [Desulfovibrio sp. X2]EPR43644.1 plasma-membrane proton-efflux P-type ATPase [Desulfovibrio sp. X2]
MEKTVLTAEELKTLPTNEVFRRLGADRGGLSGEEAAARADIYGPNEIAEEHVSSLRKFLGYFWGPIPWMIEVAAILSAAIGRFEECAIIGVLLLLNAGVGFWQEHKADNAIALLRQRLALKARVLRDEKWSRIAARELVPGDLVRVRLGDIVPADLKIASGGQAEAHVSVDESALTGESLPVDKAAGDVLFSGSVLRQGEVDAVVAATGMDTFFGRTAGLVAQAAPRSHFQRAVVKIGDYLIVLALLLVAVIVLTALFRHESPAETVQFALILAVAAIPAALPAVLSVTMAVGASRLAAKEAIVSRLTAIEELAGMDVLCSDKTGTITENRLSVGDVRQLASAPAAEVLAAGALASRAEDADPIDDAVLKAASADSGASSMLAGFTLTSFTPFDPVAKRTEAEMEGPKGRVRFAKGAPQAILALADLSGEEKKTIEQRLGEEVDGLAGRGFRALGVARADGDGPWRYLGLLGLFDPPREDSAATIKAAGEIGVAVKMVTGDHEAIGREIAQQVGLGRNFLVPEQFLDANEHKALQLVEGADGFAQVYPEHKYHIVELLEDAGHIVGMTGDGVNDAPALKKADAGIAVAGATDAARSAADIVLTLPGLSVIIDAVKESRQIFQRMQSYAIYRIAETIRVLLFITLSILAFRFYPVTAVMIVLLALFNDAPIMAIAYDRVRYSNTPEKWDMRVVLTMATFLGLLGVVSSFMIFWIGKDYLDLGMGVLQTFVFLKLAVAGHLTIFVARTRGPFWSVRPSGILLWSAVATKLLATLVAVYGLYITPIGWRLALFVWGYALAAFVVTDMLKVLLYRLVDHGDLCFAHSAACRRR